MPQHAMQTRKNILFHLTWPIFVELILQMLLGNVDQMMISRYSTTAVAAVGNANQILNFLVITFSVLCTASIILITQFKGAKDTEHTNQVYSLALLTNLIVSGGISLLIFFFHKQFFALMAVPAEAIGDASVYIVLTGSFIFLQALSMTYAAFLRSNTFMLQSMAASVVMNITNIIGNAILINGWGPIPALGVAGVAISTTVSRILGVLIMAYLFKKYVKVDISFTKLGKDCKRLIKKLLAIGLPSAGESFAYSLSQLTIMSFINLFGTMVINVKIYSSMLAMVAYIFTSAIVQATQVLVGHMLGAKQVEEADRRVWKTLKTSMLITFFTSLTLYLCSDLLFSLFTPNKEVWAMGKTILLIDLFLEQGRAINITFVRCLQTAGDIKFPVTLGIFSTWIIAVGLSYLLGVHFEMGLVGVWIAMAADELFRGVIFIFRWRAGGWKGRDLTNMSN